MEKHVNLLKIKRDCNNKRSGARTDTRGWQCCFNVTIEMTPPWNEESTCGTVIVGNTVWLTMHDISES